MNDFFKLTNLNVRNNSNLSFSLIKSEQLVSFCKENKIKAASVCDYHHFDFINFYFLCKKNKILPIWGIKKILIYKKKPFFISLFPTNYSNYKDVNSFFYANKVSKYINFEIITKNLEVFLTKCLFVFETRSFFEFEEACRIKNFLLVQNKNKFSIEFYIGINFIPKIKNIQFFSNSENKLFFLPFYSVKCLFEDDKKYLVKFRLLDRKNTGDFKDEDFNENYFHYLSYKELGKMIADNNNFTETLRSNLQSFISKIKISIRTVSKNDRESDFLNVKKACEERLVSLNLFQDLRYRELLAEELKIIKKKNYASYFNTVHITTNIFRKNGIEVGPGRGSSVSSLVSYLTGITKIDPVKNNLYFWRFLNEKRDDFPDIDVDVNDQEKAFEELIKYFGREYISKISVRKSISLIYLINSSLNFFDLQQDEKNFILENLETISKMFKENIFSFKSLKLKAIFERNSFFFNFLDKFRNLIIGLSSHPSGTIIWDKKLPRILPFNNDNDKFLVCSYPSSSLEKLGFKKFDFLSLTESLSFVSFMKKKFPQIPSYENISFHDYKTWKILKNSLVSNVFQLDSKISRHSLLKISPSSFDDLILSISLNRPGVNSNLSFASRTIKRNSWKYQISSDFINKILSQTHGNILFEEQISIIISFCMSLSIYEAEVFRKRIKSIISDEKSFNEFKTYFFEKSSEKITSDDQKMIFKKIVESVPYMFNKAHAVSYSYLTYYVSFIKANYFENSVNYFLEKDSSSTGKLFLIFSEIFLQGYEVLKPEINSSFYENVFVGSKKFVLGFSILSGVDYSVFKKIIENREEFGKYLSLRNFIDRNIFVFAEYGFENFLPWIETGILRSLDYDSFWIVENFNFFSRYIKIKTVVLTGEEIPFLNNISSYSQKKSLEKLNESEISSFNCYISYFNRWNLLSRDKKLEIFSLQNILKENFKNSHNFKVYSILVSIKKIKNFFLFSIYDINQIFDVYVSHKDFDQYKEIVKVNMEFIFEIEVFSNSNLDLSIKLKKILEI